MKRHFLSLLIVGLLLASCRDRRSSSVPVEATSGYCPVCRMKVQADSPWASEIIYSDRTKLMFETPGDLLTFYNAPANYEVSDAQKDFGSIEKIVLKDYKTRNLVDARQATFVYKSSLKGPMGPDFIAFGSGEDAEAFRASNGGTIVGLNQITAEMVRNLRKN